MTKKASNVAAGSPPGPTVEERLTVIERRLGLDHAAIRADREASHAAGALAAPLAEAR